MSTKLYSGRRRLVAATLLCMLAIFGGIGLGAHHVARRESDELFSARLATSARVLEALVAHQLTSATIARPIVIALPRELETSTSDEPKVYGHRYETKIAFQVWRDDGALLAKSASAPTVALAPLRAGFSEQPIGGVPWQVFGLRSGNVWVLTAEKDEVRQEMSHDVGMSILTPLAAGGVLMLVAVNFLLLRNMRPLSSLAALIAARAPESLDMVELPSTPLELAPIITELNHLLDRIRAAFEREQRFLNAAAHEIRTPIAAVQLHMENALRASTPAQRQSSLESAMAGARRTSKLAEQLLALSRISAGGDACQMQRLSLRALCCEVIGAVEPLIDRRGQSVGLDAQHDCPVRGEPSQLQRMLQNLIDNASVHGAAHGEILVTLDAVDGMALLGVSNDGVPIPQKEVDNLFTPYYRLPGGGAGGHGLGLAIVKEIVDQHHGRIVVQTREDGRGTLVLVSLPLA
jgi:two-component system sensor histidine kinase QseC